MLSDIRLCFQILTILLSLLAADAFAADAETGRPASTKPLRVLFIGNSYTSVNDMSSMLVAFAASPGSPRQVEVKALTADSATLRDHSGYMTTRYEIQDGKWDFVVLQEQSELPITNPERMYEAAREIDSGIKKANAKTILFPVEATQLIGTLGGIGELVRDALGKDGRPG